MSIRQRASRTLHSIAAKVEGFPGNVLRAVSDATTALPAKVARQIHLAARRVCGCHHETAAGCALYRKDGPARCECACHPAERTVSYTFRASGHEEVQAAINDVADAARKLRETPLQVRVTREPPN